MRTLRVSVRRLVEFLLRSGDIDADAGYGAGIEAMQAGSEIHRKLQAAGGDAYQAEVTLVGSFFFPGGAFNPHAARLDIPAATVSDQAGFFLRVEGRADGIIDDHTHPLIIDEIKGVSRDVSAIEQPDTLHVAQALCYAYLYLRSARGPQALTTFGERVIVRITYGSMTTGEVRQMERAYEVPDIEARFFSLLEAAQRWAAWRVHHDEARERSLAALAFPLRPRVGQRQIMEAVTAAIHEKERLYLQAPTGSGKTIATLFPALKAMGAGEVSRIAFLTAKTTTRGPVLESLELLRRQDFAANVLVVTARDKLCPLRRDARGTDVRTRPLSSLCNPHECPLARGHYDAVNDALFEAISTADVLDAHLIQDVASRHHVCPYELQRDITRWADLIICDYHYAFSPSAALFGLADEPGEQGVVLLVDEAHNLPERMREMYSAELGLGELRALERLVRTSSVLKELTEALRTVTSAFPAWEQALPDSTRSGSKGRGGQPTYQKVRVSEALRGGLETLSRLIDDTLEKAAPSADAAPVGMGIETYLALRDMDHRLAGFLGALQRAEKGYATIQCREAGGRRKLKVYCVDPSHDLEERLELGLAAVFFSGTLLPEDYHRKLLAARDEDPYLTATSSFDHSHRQVLIASDVSARFSKRGPELYARIAAYVATLTRAKAGNYLVFLPSYAMVDETERALGLCLDTQTSVVRQRPGMREDDRDRFVARFLERRAPQASLIGLCVLGGIFGESIDLPGEALVGVVVVGTGMPRASAEREVIRDHFDTSEGKGFAYAYTYPGMIKVLQAAGRLIRTEQDRGVVLLLDDRFLEDELQQAFPSEWVDVRTCTLETLPGLLA